MNTKTTALVLTAVFAAGGGASSVAAQGGDAERLERTRNALGEWVENERILAAENAKWREGRELLEAQIDLVKQQIAAVREETESERNSIVEAGARETELEQKRDTLRAGATTLEAEIAGHERRIRQLLSWLPDPLLGTIRPLIQRLPEDSGETDIGISNRYFTVLAIMKSVNEFNRDITVASEVRTLRGGASVEVAVLYVGLGQAYYANDNGDIAGVGRPGPKGWVWEQSNEAATEIFEAIAIYQNEQVARFVPLPVEVK